MDVRVKPLPVDSLLPELTATLKSTSAVIVEAPPGSGKTTRVAPSLIDAGLCDRNSQTYLVQPRRIAARATARRIADERDWTLGNEVGYQVRFDSKVSAATSLIVATEGILLRRLTADAILDGVGTVILDEFHERSLNADLLLGMLHRVQQLVRNDLRLIVMSATLDSEPLQQFLNAPVLKTTGTLHPVDIKHRPPKPRQKMTSHVADTVVQTCQKADGDILVFLPGVGEIKQVESELQKQSMLRDCEILPMHGGLPLEQQNLAIRRTDRRRIVLSTNVAETSLTIEGISTVVDSGQARVLRFEPSVGLDRLQLEPICQSSATQRAGRAGRLEAGVCIRLWDEKSDRVRPKFLDPDIRRVDLSAAVLQLYQWGEQPDAFPWFEAPRQDSLASAIQLLEQLGAICDDRITPVGEQMSRIPASPRLARMLIAGQQSGRLADVALAAAMLSERDPFLRDTTARDRSRHGRPTPPTTQMRRWRCDVTERLGALKDYFGRGTSFSQFGEVHRGAARTIRQVAEQFISVISIEKGSVRTENDESSNAALEEIVSNALLFAFPDRLARRRNAGDSRGQMVGGRGVRLAPSSGVQQGDLFLCIDVDDKSRDALVRQASQIDFEQLPQGMVTDREDQFFNPSRKQVEARRRIYWSDLVLNEQPTSINDADQCCELLIAEATKHVDDVMPDDSSAFQSYLTRLLCLSAWAPELELPTDRSKLLSDLLRDVCPGKRSFAELKSAPWLDWLKGRLTAEQQQAIDRECPERIEVPSGNHIKIEYSIDKPPVLAARIQELFSWTTTPRIAFSRVPLLLHLLAPNMRPQQVTDDLASFWANAYQVVRKDLRRRYSKHAWPEDPLTAKPDQKRRRKK